MLLNVIATLIFNVFKFYSRHWRILRSWENQLNKFWDWFFFSCIRVFHLRFSKLFHISSSHLWGVKNHFEAFSIKQARKLIFLLLSAQNPLRINPARHISLNIKFYQWSRAFRRRDKCWFFPSVQFLIQCHVPEKKNGKEFFFKQLKGWLHLSERFSAFRLRPKVNQIISLLNSFSFAPRFLSVASLYSNCLLKLVQFFFTDWFNLKSSRLVQIEFSNC